MIVSGPLLPFAALALPLLLGLLAAVPAMRPRVLMLLPIAPLPALALALSGPTGEHTELPVLLLGVRLGLDATGAMFLGASALLWALAGVFATAYMRRTHKREVFVAFWCLTLTGNLGVFLARDAVTFYVSFTAVSLPAYLLIVHDATREALRAGRIYMILALVGETSLLVGLIIACAHADSLVISQVRDALADAPGREAALALMLIGLGIKAGLVPLHVWLPLAHPQAPTPASAVLSGAIVKAGIFGMLVLLPAGAGMANWSLALVAAGLGGAYFGIVAGLGQNGAKAALAYSTVSQMGLMIAAAGAAPLADAPAEFAAVIALYAVHHGLAKGALFMSVGVAGQVNGRARHALLAAVALLALSVAGLPLTGGAVAKTALKSGLEGPAATLVAASAAGTALLLLHVWVLLRRSSAHGSRPGRLLWAPFLAAGATALVLPWLLAPAVGVKASYVLSAANLWSATWPLLAAAAIAAAVIGLRIGVPRIPAGDLVVVAERMVPPAVSRRPAPSHPGPRRGMRRLDPIDRLERGLRRWSTAGPVLLGTAVVLAALFLA
ncbi:MULTISPECIES: complex I subunit 5 family protein [unclassified Roseitalea]|uniref:complex I subunit 5 family protein n=1 Tax=unclassified Roseitalea TaxID=2639107 RepID=UPI00273F1777|nr:MULTISPECIES: complex I subunit 5 family protein [unclassified Roseitalea]